jgi:hypothetical protein
VTQNADVGRSYAPAMRRSAVVVLAALAAVSAAGASPSASREAPAITPVRMAVPVWTFVRPAGKTKCAHGGKFGFWARLASLERLVVFFEGGGGCWSYRTCVPGSSWYDPEVTSADDPRRFDGILAVDDARNPFRSWSMVFIPSCGGDVFIGGADHTYRDGGRRLLIHHRGWDNARAALAWAFRFVPSPRRVLVTGTSAGSVGSAFHAPAVIDRYRGADVVQLGDSLALLNGRPLRLTQWGWMDHLPVWMRAAPELQPGRFTMAAFLLRLTAHYPRNRFARFNFDRDLVQERYFADDPSGARALPRAAEEDGGGAAGPCAELPFLPGLWQRAHDRRHLALLLLPPGRLVARRLGRPLRRRSAGPVRRLPALVP